MKRSFGWWLVCLGALGCDDDPAPDGPEDVGPPPAVVILPLEECVSPAEDLFPSPACADRPQPVLLYPARGIGDPVGPAADPAAVVRQLAGRWTRCPHDVIDTPVFAHPFPEGVEFTADGRWAELHLVDGAPVASTAEDEHGTFTVERSGVALLNANGESISGALEVRLSCNPHQLSLHGSPFARGPGAGVLDSTGHSTDDFPTLTCEIESGQPVSLVEDRAEAMAQVAGIWHFKELAECDAFAGDFFYPPTESDFGIELGADGYCWRLTEQDGQVVRGGHVGDVGRWELEQKADGTWLYVTWLLEQLDPSGDDLGFHLGNEGPIVLTENPRQLHWELVGVDVRPAVFVAPR